MAEYKLTNSDAVTRTEDNASIPFDEDNTDYRNYQVWLAAGNTPDPADPLPVPTYADKRREKYPPIGDQLDALFHAGVFPADMAAKIQAVKDKYPKE